MQSFREIERSLTAELHDDALGQFLVVDIEHVFERERLEVEFVARVVIGRNGFRIRIDHDGFESKLAKGEGGVDAAIIEFDSLAHPVRAAAEDHDLALIAPAHLVLAAVGGIIIRRIRFELRRTGIDQAIRRRHFFGDAFRSNFFFG